jgi:hypothetical protein
MSIWYKFEVDFVPISRMISKGEYAWGFKYLSSYLYLSQLLDKVNPNQSGHVRISFLDKNVQCL